MATLPLPPTTDVQIVRVTKALFDAAPGFTYLNAFRDYANQNDGVVGLTNALVAFLNKPADQLADLIVANLHLEGDAATNAKAYLTAQFSAPGANIGQVIVEALTLLATLENDPVFGQAAQNFNASVAQAFAFSTNPANTTTDLTVLQQADEVPTTPPPSQGLALTTGVDHITLTPTNKSVVGIVDTNNSVSTLNAGDVIVGTGVDGDELRIIQNATSYPGSATITDVDTITVQVGAGGGVTFNATGVTGAKQIIMADAVGAQIISNIGSLDTAVGIRNTTQNLTADWQPALLSGGNDAVTLLLDTATGGATGQAVTVSNGVEKVVVKTSGGKSDINTITDGVANGSLKTLEIEAAAALRIRAADADIVTFDASKSTAGVDIGVGVGKNITFTGGSGDDRLRFSTGDFTKDDTVAGGDGNDRLDIALNANLAAQNHITGFENIAVKVDDGAAANTFTLNLAGNSDVNTITMRETTDTPAGNDPDTVTLTNVAKVLDKIVYEGTGTTAGQLFDDLTVNFAPGVGTGSSDTTAIEVTNKDATGNQVALATGNAFTLGTLTMNGVENLSLTSQAAGNVTVQINDTALQSLTLAAQGNLTFTAALNSTKLTSVDATGVTGKLTINTSQSNESVTISLGNGNNVVTVGDGNAQDDVTTIHLGSGANIIATTYDGAVGANGFFIATNFQGGVGGDVIDLMTAINFQKVADTATAAAGASTVIVVTAVDGGGNADPMAVTGSDEPTLVGNFIAYASDLARTFDNVGAGNLVGDIYVVQGNDNNLYMFRVDADAGTAGQIDAADTIQLIGILQGTGLTAAQLYAGNFI